MMIKIKIEDKKKINLCFWYDLNSHLLTLKLTLLEPSRTSIPKMPSTHFFTNFQPTSELLREPKPLIQIRRTSIAILPLLRYRRSRLLPLSPRQHSPYVLSRRRRRERPLEEPPRRGGRAPAPSRRRRRLLQEARGARAVEREKRRLFSGGDVIFPAVVLGASGTNWGFRDLRRVAFAFSFAKRVRIRLLRLRCADSHY